MKRRKPGLAKAARRVKLILLDVDGVLTDGGIILGETSGGADIEIKKFSVRDGFGLTLARAAGYKLGLLTGRSSRLVARRAEEIGFDVVEQGHFDKSAAFDGICESQGVTPEEVLYMGDDLLDLRILTRVGLPVTVPGAPDPVKRSALYVTERRGGEGAVREAIDLLLELAGRTRHAHEALDIRLPKAR